MLNRSKIFKKANLKINYHCRDCQFSNKEKLFSDKFQKHLIRIPKWLRRHIDRTYCTVLKQEVYIGSICDNFSKIKQEYDLYFSLTKEIKSKK